MAAIANLTVDSVDLFTFGWRFGGDGEPDPQGIDQMLERARSTATAVPDADGEIDLDGGFTTARRPVAFPGFIEAANMAAVQTLLDKLKYHLTKGDTDGFVLLGTDRDTTRVLRCYAKQIDVVWGVAKFSAARATVTLLFEAIEPWWRATTPDSHSFTTATAMPVGTLKSPVVLTVTAGGGGCASPTILYKDSAGVTRGRIDMTASGGLAMAAADVLSLDTETGDITLTHSGVTTNAAKYRASAATYPFDLDPRHGDWLAPSYPTLTGSVVSGSATFAAAYTRRFR